MSPQKENGFTPIAHELFEAFYCCKLTEYERCIVMHLWRKTYGWGKKEDWISNSQFSGETGIARSHVTRTLKLLKTKKIVSANGKKLSVNKRYNEWNVDWRKLPHQVTIVTSPGNKKLPHQVPTIERKKLYKRKSEADASAGLNNNEINMAWNTQGDDIDLDAFVDLDGDGTTKEENKKPTRKYPNAPAVRKIFQDVLGRNPANWKVNKNQLQACENLYTERTPEKVRNALEYFKANKDVKYCPQITSPFDLDSKWTKLGEFKLNQNGN